MNLSICRIFFIMVISKSYISLIDYVHLRCMPQCLYQGERDFLEVLENDPNRNSGKNISSLISADLIFGGPNLPKFPKFRQIKSA